MTDRKIEDRWLELTVKHNMRCLWSDVIGNRTIKVECWWVPSAGVTILITLHYDKPIPRKYSSKRPWPKAVGMYSYFPAGGVTWESMDEALESLQPKKPDAA